MKQFTASRGENGEVSVYLENQKIGKIITVWFLNNDLYTVFFTVEEDNKIVFYSIEKDDSGEKDEKSSLTTIVYTQQEGEETPSEKFLSTLARHTYYKRREQLAKIYSKYRLDELDEKSSDLQQMSSRFIPVKKQNIFTRIFRCCFRRN